MANKKYQVFVSSTFLDLKDERQAVSRAILNLGHIPAGMELFPASDTDQLSFIKKVIDDCDYYILIIGGRYGSITESGLSFTELEYNYAVETKKPVLAFLHSDIKEIKSRNVETTPEQLEKLSNFRETVSSGRLVEFWTTVENLESKALLALTNAFSEYPQIGWRRDTDELSKEAQVRFDRLRSQFDITRERLDETRRLVAALREKLQQYEALGEAIIEVRFTAPDLGHSSAEMTAEEAIREFASELKEGITVAQIKEGLENYIKHKVKDDYDDVSLNSAQNVALFFEVFEICNREGDTLRILDEKKWLLKAAFRPLKKVLTEGNDDIIPF